MWALISKCVWVKKDFKSNFFFLQRRMWKVLFESLKQKMYHLSEACSCHVLGCLVIRVQIYFTKPDSKYICGCCQQSYHDSGLHTWNGKALRYLPSYYVYFFSYCLHTCYPQNSTTNEMLYIKMSLKRRKIRISPRVLGSHWMKLEAISIIMQGFKNKAFGGANCISSPSSIFFKIAILGGLCIYILC